MSTEAKTKFVREEIMQSRKQNEKLMEKSIENEVCERKEEAQRPENPLLNASIISKLLFTWPYSVLKTGMERPLEDKDLPDISDCDTSEAGRGYIENLWNEELRNHPERPSLHRALLKDFFKTIWYIHPMMIAGSICKVIQAVALGMLIETFETGQDGGYMYAAIVVACGLVVLFEHHHVFYIAWTKAMRIRIAAVSAIYHKSLRLSSTHQDTSASYGKIMNLASNDVERFLLAGLFISHLIWSPLQAIGILVLGCLLLGPAFAAGFGLLVFVFVPLQMYLSGRFSFLRSKIAALTDERVTFVSQSIHGARVMKMSGFEWHFLDRIQLLRQREVAQIQYANNLRAMNEALYFAANVSITVVVFLVHIWSGGILYPGNVFMVFALINVLQIEMTKHVSLGVMGVSEVYVSITRIQKFLEFPELPPLASVTKGDDVKECSRDACSLNSSVAISLSNITSYWNDVYHPYRQENSEEESTETSSTFLALSDVNLDCHKGELTCIIGAVGSGKSALLQAIVGELPIARGAIHRKGYNTLSYAAQDPWIMDGTVKENIVLGKEFDKEWYNQTIHACGLSVDFQQLRDGDGTIVGDRGVQLSGGQRARIGLARAVYLDADILVADDPLSAVDAKVGRQLFYDGIMGLMVNRGKCVVLATHQHQYIGESRCVLMEHGRIICTGTYDKCIEVSKGKLKAHKVNDSVDNLSSSEDRNNNSLQNGKELDETKNKLSATDKRENMKGNDLNNEDNSEDGKESNVKGFVRFETYLNYIQAMGGLFYALFLFLTFCVAQASVLIAVTTVARWAERPPSEQSSWDILGQVIGLCFAVIVLAIFRAFVSFRAFVKASQRLHDRMAKSVLRSKIEFFDTNPLGRILNRFSADVGSNDDLLPMTLFDFAMIAFIVFGAIITTVVTLPFALIIIPPLLWYFVSVRRVFVTSSRELKRMEGLARSPIFAMLSESLGGIATIRTNHALQYFQKKFETVHDDHTRAFFAFVATSRWLGFRMDGLMFLFMSLVSFLAVLFDQQNWFGIDPAVLGLSLSLLIQLASMFQWCIRQSAEVVNLMVSIERVVEFGKLEPEADLKMDTDSAIVELEWPTAGALDVKELSVRYRSTLPIALDKISFSVPGGSRVGIVGRTGSGKSTVVQTLFRLLEAENGSICVDGVDIAKLGLHTLRTKISVIPQVPTLFSGCSVRENLDLFGMQSDDAVQKALEDAHMAQVVRELPHGWNSVVSEGGSNFSVGQRQLLCLARAILSKNKILILDEATASVDRRTDEMLQEALKESFKDSTILAVAHRLETIIDYDLILVLGSAQVLEFGSPSDLIQKEGGVFAGMVNDTGEAMSLELRRRALQN